MVIPYKVISYTPGPRWPRSSDTSFKSGSGGCCLVTSWQVWWWCWWRWRPATPWQLPASFSVVVHSAVTHLVCRDPPIHYWSLTPSQRVGAKTGGGVDSILKRRFLETLEVKVLTSLLMSRVWESIMGCFLPDRMSCVVRMISKANHIELVEAQLRHTPSQLKISTPGTKPCAMSLLIALSPFQYDAQRWLSKKP